MPFRVSGGVIRGGGLHLPAPEAPPLRVQQAPRGDSLAGEGGARGTQVRGSKGFKGCTAVGVLVILIFLLLVSQQNDVC